MSRSLSPVVAALAVLLTVRALATPVINEIMYHPAGVPENTAQEWIEIYNDSAASTFDLSGWQFTKGVAFTFPNGTSLAPGGYLVVAANVAAFQAAHPGFAGQLVGGWVGKLSNSSDHLVLADALAVTMDEVHYADEGEWGTRGRGPLVLSHRGWEWFTDADGGGKTIELRNPALAPFDCGQNWGVSAAVGGSPGAVNSVASANVAPLVKDVKHKPSIPHTTDPIVVSCNLHDEGTGATATLFWRKDGTVPFNSLPMTDTDGDGDVEATIPAQTTNLSIVEYYISATDGTNTRTWPAPARTSDIGIVPETFAQVTNALVLVDNSFDANAQFQAAGSHPIYRLIMTAAEKAELLQIQTNSNQAQSDAAMNATFVSHDGVGVEVRYLIGIRNRGTGSRLGPPNNYNVGFRNDELWEDRGTLQLNCRYPHSQVLGALCFELAGIAQQESAAVKVRVNGVDLAETGLRMYGRYARNETMSGDWAKRHYPNDPDGNIYFCDDHDTGGANPPGDLGSGEFRYEGTNPLAYSDTYQKKTNEDLNDYSDLITLTDKLTNTPDATYATTIPQYLDLDQFYTFIATDALIGNQEGGLQSGRADDVGLYRGMVDTRFKMIPHDFDSVFAFGLTGQDPGGPGGGGGFGDPFVRSIFSYDGEAPTSGADGVLGLHRLFTHPALVPRYYAKLLEQMDKWYNHATLDPILDQVLGGWVAATGANVSVASAKAFIDTRRTNVLAQIQQNYALNVTTGAPAVGGYTTTTDGSATINGTFNVAKIYSITVNGQLAQWFYRTAGADAAGSWKLAVPVGGGSVLTKGLNKVIVNFWDAPNGTGKIVNSLSADVFYNVTGTNVAGTLTAGSLRLTTPSAYIPGKPFLARVELLNALGELDRTAWDTTVTLSSNVGGITLPTLPLYNGQGSVLVTAGGSGGGGTTQLIVPGGTSAAPNASAPDWRMLDAGAEPAATWKSDQAFVDSGWTLGKLQAGGGDGDERTTLNNVAGSAANTRRAFYFRKIFNVADPTAFSQLLIKAIVDDGAVFYLNGTQVAIDNMPAGTPTLTTPASANRSAPAEATFNTYDISAFLNLLVTGPNLLAVEVHNFSDAAPTYSADLSFDCELDGVAASTDPGTFTLTATGGGFSAQKTITSLTTSPTMTNVSGTLAAGTTTWSGVMHVTGDVTVPAGSTLNISAGTTVLLDGTVFTQGVLPDAGGKNIIVNGTLNATGTAANPVSFTSTNSTDRWGEITQAATGAVTLKYCLLSHACHSLAGGHTGTGPMIRIGGGTTLIEDSVLSDSPGKTIFNDGNPTITIRRSICARTVTGPEVAGATLTVEDSNFNDMLAVYRQFGAQDDEDSIYIHDSGGRTVLVSGSVFGPCDDDGIDLLQGNLTVQDCIIRNAFDKGVSLLENDITLRRCQIIGCDFGVSSKTRIGDEIPPFTATLENVTIVSATHPTNTSDQSGGGGFFHNVGIHTRNKYGTGPNAHLYFNLKNCILSATSPVENDYGTVGTPFPYTTITYTCYQKQAGTNPVDPTPPADTGDITADPLFVAAGANDYHLTAASPAHNTGDPASPLDTDGSRADMGALPYTGAVAGGGTITWTPAGGPYHVTGDVTIPSGTTLVINAGTSVLVDLNHKITVNGVIKVNGTDSARVVFSSVPGVTATDPITGIAGQPAKWAGLVVVGPAIATGPAITGSEFRYCTFLNAQPAVAAGNTGSLGIIRAFALIDHCIFLGTHLRQVYGENCALQVQYSTFVDPFDPANNADNPVAYALDNIAEPLKVANANFASPNYAFGLPVGGYFRVWYNEFRGNKGHNDVFDADSGGFNNPADLTSATPNPILDCRYNNFVGFTGDEHIDLGGDAYVAGNIFQRGHKDIWTNDHGYSNVISSGDKSGQTTIWVARNVAFDVDHIMNCKAATATIFENNTIANLHADFAYTSTPPVPNFTQNVKCSAINQYVPEDDSPSRGDGAYIAYNIFHNIPRVVSWADLPATAATKLEVASNYLNGITDNSVGPVTAQYAGGTLHPAGFTALGAFVQPGDPQFVDEAGKNYALKPTSPAHGTAPGGIDYGASVAEWIHITGGPTGTTEQTAASFTISGAAMVAYKWRLDGGAWSAVQQIGNGLIFPRGATPTVRASTLTFNSLTPGAHTLEVIGRDPAGNWQDTDLARTVGGLPPLAPTARTWTVDTTFIPVQLNEILADSATLPDRVELLNTGGTPVALTGWSLTDDPLVPAKLALTGTITAGGFATFSNAALSIDKDGETIYLYHGAVLVDSVTFGQQITDKTIGRHPATGAWVLCAPTLGAANTPISVGDFSTLKISEWFASGDVLYDADWIELQNTSASPAALAGLRVTTNRPGDPSAYTFPPLSFVAGSGFVRLVANGTATPGHLPFKLDAQYEGISLLNPDGSVLDTVAYYPQTTDYSMGRDANGNIVFYELPTRGFTNGTGDPAYANALALLHGLRITEIMFNAIGGSNYDYVELRNVGATPLQLGGVRFVTGIDFTFPAMTLNPGQNVIVCKDLTKFRARYGPGPLVAGTFGGQLDNGGETLGLQLPPPFDANVLTFSYNDTWYASTDGFGTSLVVFDPLTKANVWGDRDTWRASAENGGNPDGFGARSDTYSGWSALHGVLSVTADDDKDGVPALAEYGLGMDPAQPNGGDGIAGAPFVTVNASGHAELHFLVPATAAPQGHGMAEAVYNVQASSDLAAWTTIATKTFTTSWTGTVNVGAPGGGFVPVVAEDTVGGSRRYLRLQVVWVP